MFEFGSMLIFVSSMSFVSVVTEMGLEPFLPVAQHVVPIGRFSSSPGSGRHTGEILSV